MSQKKYLQGIIKTNQDIIKKYLEDFNEEESLVRVADLINHLRWQTGHLAFYADLTAKILGGEGSFPEEWDHFKGGEPLKEDGWYPPYEEIRNKLFGLFDKTNEFLDKIPDAALDEEIEPVPKWKTVRMEGLLFLCTHDLYHVGQIVLIRKSLGKSTMG
jgi:hypothetical protein